MDTRFNSASKANVEAQDAKHTTPRVRIDTPTTTPPSTPTPAAAQANHIYREIKSIHQVLAPLKSLAPSDLVNTSLTRLVNLCIQPYSSELISHFYKIDNVHPLCQALQSICATAEGHLERHWAQFILSETERIKDPPTPQSLLQTFPYYKNYIDLSHLEASLLRPFLPPSPSATLNFAFLGSGPLPLTSLLLPTHFPAAKIHNIDRDAEALVLSERLTRALSMTSFMTFSCEDATRVEGGDGATEWSKFDVVFLAALVGMRSCEKVEVLRGLRRRLRVGCLVVVRSARGLRGVLYPVLELSEELMGAGFEVLAEMHPWTSVVNSVVVLRVEAID